MIGFFNYEYLRMMVKSRDIPVIFIDRDGVINKRMPPHQHVLKWEDFCILPGVYEALRICNEKNIPTIVVSNQRCISLGTLSIDGINGINDRLQSDLRAYGVHLDGFFYCPHGDSEGCNCRKPGTGLFEEAERELLRCGITIDKNQSWMVGDENYDVEAGKRFGIRTVLVTETKRKKNTDAINFEDEMAKDLLNAIKTIVETLETEAKK